MSFDASRKFKRSELTLEDRIRSASRLQLDALELVSRTHGSKAGLVFHGGTSIAFGHGSPRWSEDLDFMATPEAIAGIFARSDHIAEHLQLRSSLFTPGARIDVARKKGGGSIGEVAKLNLRWEHPEMIGAIRIKVEFYACPEERLLPYEHHPTRIGWRGRTLREPVAAATLESVWADKILAMALRPALKHRDIHDLGLIAPRLRPDFPREDYLRASMGIYDKRPEEVAEGLSRSLVTDHLADSASFLADMERWFAPAAFSEMAKTGVLDRAHRNFLEEFDRARDILEGMTCSESPCP